VAQLSRKRRLRAYARPQILAIDEIGYLTCDAHAADLLFQVISRRYEQRSIVVTTNLLFKHWDTVFPNASCAVSDGFHGTKRTSLDTANRGFNRRQPCTVLTTERVQAFGPTFARNINRRHYAPSKCR